jgi:uncharacterized protein YjeT (DUF2065 family)
MNAQIPSGLKTTFLVHTIVGVIVGLAYFLFPNILGNLLNWDMSDGAYRVVGAAILGYGMSSLWAYQAQTWAEVKIITQTELVWSAAGAIAVLWGMLTGGAPMIAALHFVLLTAFLVAFGYFYSKAPRDVA